MTSITVMVRHDILVDMHDRWEDIGCIAESQAKRRARGYRSTRNYIAMIYLVIGKLDLEATHLK